MNTAENSAPHTYALGGYEITSAAGAGGMGVVYKGVDPALGRPVAIKVLKDELQTHAAVVARFRREAEAIATLSHPNIVRIYAVGDRDSLPYIVMEFVDGAPLSDVLIESGSLPWEDVLDIGVQVADALVCAHECQVIHRDIKPANILIREDGLVKVTDFGIAKVLNASTQLTVDGARIGTPQYMCPERCKNLPITPGSDIYSLGVMLFQCITGRLPFEANSSAELINKIASEVPRRVRALKPDVPESVDRLIAYMLEKEAANRPADSRVLRELMERVRKEDCTADDMLPMDRALEAIRAETPLPPPPATEATTVESCTWRDKLQNRWFRMPSWLRVGIAAGVLVGPALAIFSLAGNREDISERFAPRGEVRRWTERNSLAYFESETGSVVTGALQLPGMALAQLEWIGGADGAVVRLEGLDGGLREGETALLTINPYLRRVNVSLAPLGSPHAPDDLRLLAAGSGSADTSGMVLVRDGATWFLSAVPGTDPTLIAPWPAQAAILPSAREDGIILFVEGEGAGRLLRVNDSQPGTVVEEVLLDGVVEQMAVEDGGEELALWVRGETGGRIELRQAGRLEQSGLVVAEGRLHLSRRAFQSGGEALAFVTNVAAGVGQAVIQSGLDFGDRLVLGDASAVAWRPGVDEVLFMAPDHAGRRQLWCVMPDQPDDRRQITFLDSGLNSTFCIADDGAYAVATVPDSNRFVIVVL